MCPSTGSEWTPVRDELVKALVGRVPIERVARALDVPPTRVRARAYALGVIDKFGERRDLAGPIELPESSNEEPCEEEPCESASKEPSIPPETLRKACEMATSNTLTVIANELGVGRRALRSELARIGVVPATRRQVSDQRKARIVELAKNGMTRQEIAETVGCSLSMVGHAMNEHGDELGITKYWTSEETERLIELKRAGYTNRAIGADIGRSKEQVERRINWLRKRGFEI